MDCFIDPMYNRKFMIPVFKPSLGIEEEKEVIETLRSNWIGNGPKTKRFEEEFASYVGVKNALAVNSASAALHLALVCLDLKPGDEVITPSLTFVATNHPILLVGATPVFCDVDKDTLCADPKDIERKITKKTKAIIIVHYGGHPVNLTPVLKLCKKHNIQLIEDCAHAEGAYYKNKHVGGFGDFSCFSFAAIKNMTTGDGGMLVAKRKKDIKRARILAWSGISQGTWNRMSGKKQKWEYNVLFPGWKYQMNDIAAGIGLAQLKKLDNNNAKRRKIAENYIKGFNNTPWLTCPSEYAFGKSAWHNFVIKVPEKKRDALSQYLLKKGIGTTVHYKPTHTYSLYKKYQAIVPVTEKVWKKILLLPMFPSLTLEEQKYIIEMVKMFPI